MTNGGNNNAEMAVASNGRLYVAALINGQAAYIGYSGDQGTTWTAMDLPLTPDAGGGANEGLNPTVKPGGQGYIHFSIVVDPTDPNIVYVAGDRQDTPFPNFIGAGLFRKDLPRRQSDRAQRRRAFASMGAHDAQQCRAADAYRRYGQQQQPARRLAGNDVRRRRQFA